ncbi:transmembrane protease serine 4 [Rhinophrynus dorsalis]
MNVGRDEVDFSYTAGDERTTRVTQPLSPTRTAPAPTNAPAPATSTPAARTPGPTHTPAPANRTSAPTRTPASASRTPGPTRTPGPVRGTPRPASRPGARAPPVSYKPVRVSLLRRYCVPIVAVVLVLASLVVISILIKVVLDNYYYFCIKSFKFIPLDKWCDGNSDCSGGEDESRCVQPIEINTFSTVRLSEDGSILQLYVASSRSWSLACYENWDTTKAKAVCAQLGYFSEPTSRAVSISGLGAFPNLSFSSVQVLSDRSISVVSYGGGSCASGNVVSLRCSDCGKGQKQQRIIGGNISPIQNYPWQCSLQYMGQHVCGGSILSTRWILSAAHCFEKNQKQVDRWRVQTGSTTLNYLFASPVDKIFIHSKYILNNKPNDIAILKLKSDLKLSESVQPVCLPGYDNNLLPGADLWVTGWGHTVEGGVVLSSQLQEVSISLISSDVCNADYFSQILSTMICAGRTAGGADTCQGDSGGPLVSFGGSSCWEQVGIVSWGDGCGRPGKPGVYTKVSAYLDWINGVMKQES